MSMMMLIACNSVPDKKADENLVKIEGLTAENYPIVDGSTATMPLMAATYSKLLGVPLEEAETFVKVSTTSPAWRNMINNNSASLLIVYEAPETVKEEIEASKVDLEITPLGRDGLVFLSNTENKVDNLTQEQIKDIYTGKTTNWNEVGGDDSEIIPFQRDKESGSQALFEKLILKGTKPMEAPTSLQPLHMGGLIDGVAYYDGTGAAIGYSVFYYASEMYTKPNLKLLKVDDIEPTVKTIGDGRYPLVNNFYAVIRKNEASDSPARLVYNWLISDEGAKIVQQTGYAPISK